MAGLVLHFVNSRRHIPDQYSHKFCPLGDSRVSIQPSPGYQNYPSTTGQRTNLFPDSFRHDFAYWPRQHSNSIA